MTEAQITHLAKKVSDTFFCEPPMERWGDLIGAAPGGEMLGRSRREWRELTRRELGLPVYRPVIATGHQTLLWHPGILAKYIARDAAAHAFGFAQANLVVDQHVGDFGEFEAPIRRDDGSLAVLRLKLTDARPDVPMALHPAFVPKEPPRDVRFAIGSVGDGVDRIIDAIRSHADAPNAAIQMSRALADLAKRWAGPAMDVTATGLCETTLARAMMERMVEEPKHCVETYNRAVAAAPEAGIPPLDVRGEDVELPLWRIEGDGLRVRACVRDVERFIEGEPPRPLVAALHERIMPRALFMTALVRLGMCDLFIHGTGGAIYDRAMEIWIREWLGVEVARIAIVTADVRLPLMEGNEIIDVEEARHEARHLWHDPPRDSHDSISEAKRTMVDQINRLPRNSAQRRRAYYGMHERLEAMRDAHREKIDAAMNRIDDAAKRAADAQIAARRDWAFPLYPETAIDELADAIRARGPRSAARRG